MLCPSRNIYYIKCGLPVTLLYQLHMKTIRSVSIFKTRVSALVNNQHGDYNGHSIVLYPLKFMIKAKEPLHKSWNAYPLADNN